MLGSDITQRFCSSLMLLLLFIESFLEFLQKKNILLKINLLKIYVRNKRAVGIFADDYDKKKEILCTFFSSLRKKK